MDLHRYIETKAHFMEQNSSLTKPTIDFELFNRTLTEDTLRQHKKLLIYWGISRKKETESFLNVGP